MCSNLTLLHNIHFFSLFQIKKPRKKFEVSEYDDSTDSECEMDYDITDEISVEAQEQIAKYLTENRGSHKMSCEKQNSSLRFSDWRNPGTKNPRTMIFNTLILFL